MKRYTLSGADAFTHTPDHPERTARRDGTGMNFDVTYQVWPSRGAMLTTLAMQDRREPHYLDWRAVRKGA